MKEMKETINAIRRLQPLVEEKTSAVKDIMKSVDKLDSKW